MNIKQFRKRHNLSQRQLASLLKVNSRTVYRWEDSTRTPSKTVLELLKRLEQELVKEQNDQTN